jgi:hypothetical protein
MSRRPLVIPPHHADESMLCAGCRQEWPCDTFKTAKFRAERTPQLSRSAVIGERR